MPTSAEQTQQIRDAANALDLSDQGNTETRDASGRGAVIGGNASAKTAMGGGGSGGGGGGGGGGGAGYSLGASLADSTTQSLGFSGDAGAHIGGATFGDFASNFGGTQTTGLTGKTLAIIGGVAAVAMVVLVIALRRAR